MLYLCNSEIDLIVSSFVCKRKLGFVRNIIFFVQLSVMKYPVAIGNPDPYQDWVEDGISKSVP